MYKHILIAIDGSDVGQKGLEHGLSLAKTLKAEAIVITVSEPFPFSGGDGVFGYSPTETVMTDYRAGQEQAANAVLAAAAQAAERIGVTADVVHMPDAPPAEAIIDTAKTRNCDLIVMGSHGRRGFGRLLLGSKTAEVVTHSQIPVLVVR